MTASTNWNTFHVTGGGRGRGPHPPPRPVSFFHPQLPADEQG